jgi:hypothetical protein
MSEIQKKGESKDNNLKESPKKESCFKGCFIGIKNFFSKLCCSIKNSAESKTNIIIQRKTDKLIDKLLSNYK